MGCLQRTPLPEHRSVPAPTAHGRPPERRTTATREEPPSDAGARRLGRVSAATPADRVRTLLLRADNVLKNTVPGGDDDDRARRARAALTEALEVAQDPSVDARVRELVQRRLDGLDALEAGA